MVLEVFETESHFLSENIYLNRTDHERLRKVHAEDNTSIIRSQSSRSKKLNFFIWPDLASGFVNKRSEYEIRC